jgi:DNA polymerase
MSDDGIEALRAELGALAGEVAELLRLEHEAGAIGVESVHVHAAALAPALVHPAGSSPTRSTEPQRVGAGLGEAGSVAVAAARDIPARAGDRPSAPRSAQAREAVAPTPAPSMEDVDALLAQARRARAPQPTAAPPVAPADPGPVAVGPVVATGPVAPGRAPASDDRRVVLQTLAAEAAACRGCRLHESRTKSVFSRGTPDAELVFVGEGPGFNEDKQGEPFVGAAGQLLDKMIGAMGLSRDGVYVCNVVKCRPPENRTPLPDESAACARFLDGQLGAIRPRVVVALGRCAAERLGCAEVGRSWRGSWGEYQGVPVMPTYHPAYLLRNAEMKRPVWEDLQKVMQRLAAARGSA